MAKCRVVKGGWFWLGVPQEAGAVLDQSPEWIANRVADGLVEPVADESPIEQAIERRPEAEAAVAPRQRKRK